MVIGSGGGNVVCCFFGEDLGKVSIFQWEGDFGFCLISGDGEFCCCRKFDNKWGAQEKAFAITSEDPIDLVVVQGVLEVLILHVVV